jgi:hypothetical protein
MWQKAHQFVLKVYRLTRPFPRSEIYGLSSQFRRAAVSIAANIAEGSIEESRDYLILAEDLQYGDVDELRRLLAEVSKLLEAYSRAILNSDS